MKWLSDEYRSYIVSKEWYARRAGRLIAADFSCQQCGSNVALQVHHLTYKRLGHEEPSDLIVLCRICHQEQHNARE
jgi:5-methylcytosine-specific restriction endonuclease McrA